MNILLKESIDKHIHMYIIISMFALLRILTLTKSDDTVVS